jgi:uncharacterized circularly permuted ATP-grasp superfamily protein
LLSGSAPPPDSYPAGAAVDEAFDGDGIPRPAYAELLDALRATDLTDLAARVTAHAKRAGVRFGEADFVVDPVPRVITTGEWELLSRGLTQRTRALHAFLADAYGERRMVAAGRIPERVIESASYYEPDMAGIPAWPVGFVAGLDLVRGDDAELRVLEDNTRTPSGLAYAVAARRALDAELPFEAPSARLDPAEAFPILAASLRDSAPRHADDPHVVMVSDGPGNSAWHEHEQVAAALGVPVLTPRELTRRGDELHAGGRAVDVIYRRTDEDRLRDEEGRPTWLADLVLDPLRARTVAVVNPPGAGLADDKLAHAYVEEMVRFLLDEEPVLRSVHTYDLGEPAQLEEALQRLGELVVKPRDGYGGEGVVICRLASAAELRDVERMVRADPGSYVAQEAVMLSTHPTVIEGRLEPRHVDLRPFVVGGGESAAVVPGALTRVAFGAGELVVNSSRNGGGKDTWLMG